MISSNFTEEFLKLKKLKNMIITNNVLQINQIMVDFNIIEWLFNVTLLQDFKNKQKKNKNKNKKLE